MATINPYLGNGLTPFPYTMAPMNATTPLTFREGITFQAMLEQLRDWTENVVAVEFTNAINKAFTDFQAGIANAEQTVILTKNAWQALFDAFMADVTAQIAILNDLAVESLIRNALSKTGIALREIFATNVALTAKDTAMGLRVDGVNTTMTTAFNGRLSDATLKGLVKSEGINLLGTDAPYKTAVDAAQAAKVADLTSATRVAINKAIVDQKGETFQRWKDAVQAQATSCARVVISGDSIAQGGRVSSNAWQWGDRLSALYTDRPVILLTDANTTVPTLDNDGVQFYNMAEGGRTSVDYLTLNKVAALSIIKPTLMFHGLAANDITQNITPTAFYNNIVAWLDKIKAVSPNTMHVFILANEPNAYVGALKYADFEAQYQKLQDNGYGFFLNIWKIIQKNVGTKLTDRYGLLYDAIHYDNNGNKIIMTIVGDHMGAPRWDYIPREYVQPAAFTTTGALPANPAETVIAVIKVKRKPYIRYVRFNVNVDVIVSAAIVGGMCVQAFNSANSADVAFNRIYHSQYMVSAINNTFSFNGDSYLMPNKDYDIVLTGLPVAAGGAGGIMTISTDSAKLKFTADLSPA